LPFLLAIKSRFWYPVHRIGVRHKNCGLAMQVTKTTTPIGIDLVAMCVNDLIVGWRRAPVLFDYYATGKLM